MIKYTHLNNYYLLKFLMAVLFHLIIYLNLLCLIKNQCLINIMCYKINLFHMYFTKLKNILFDHFMNYKKTNYLFLNYLQKYFVIINLNDILLYIHFIQLLLYLYQNTICNLMN